MAERRVHILNGLRRLNIVAAELDRERENPQVIFENMNTKKRSLTKSDLIRNYVLLDMAPDDQTELYKKHWRPMEEGFDQKTYATDFDEFILRYLAFKKQQNARHQTDVRRVSRFCVRENPKYRRHAARRGHERDCRGPPEIRGLFLQNEIG